MVVPRLPDAVHLALTTQHLLAPLASYGLLDARAKASSLQTNRDWSSTSWTCHLMNMVAAVKQCIAFLALQASKSFLGGKCLLEMAASNIAGPEHKKDSAKVCAAAPAVMQPQQLWASVAHPTPQQVSCSSDQQVPGAGCSGRLICAARSLLYLDRRSMQVSSTLNLPHAAPVTIEPGWAAFAVSSALAAAC